MNEIFAIRGLRIVFLIAVFICAAPPVILILCGQITFSDFPALLLVISGLICLAGVTFALKQTGVRMVKDRFRIQVLEEREQLYRSFFEEDLSGAFISKPDSRLVICNPEFARILGFQSVDEAVGYNLDKLYPESFSRADFLTLLTREKRLERFESKLIRIDGKVINVIENAIGVFHENGRLAEIRGYIMDITEQKSLETELRQSHKMESIGTLAGGIAHDFNNILYHILGYAEMILEDVPGGSPIKENIKEILNSAQRAKALVDQILTFSRKSEPDMKPIEFGPVLEEAVKLIRSMLPTSIDIRVIRDERKGVVKADPVQMHQVLMNLSTNAYHAMREKGGLLEMRVGNFTLGGHETPPHPQMPPGAYLTVTVRDTGAGIPKEYLERIFDPYFTTKSKDQGAGMGLSVVHGIIKSHDGYILVSSEYGKGTAFDIYIPFLEGAAVQPEPQETERSLMGDEHILLVDDEIPIIKMVSLALKRHGYRVTALTSSAEALETFKKNPYVYHLVLTDMTMPGMTGDKLAENIKRIRSDTPVIISTGYSDMIDEARAEKIGVQALIMKPISKNRLLAVIRNALDANGAPKPAAQHQRPPRVLIIDDDKSSRTIFTFYLQQYTNYIDVAETGEEGVFLRKKNDYDIVFTDIEMPGLNGFETTEAIRAWELEQKKPSVQIIGLSGHSIMDMEKRIEASGMDGYLQKPFKNGDFAVFFSRYVSLGDDRKNGGGPLAAENDEPEEGRFAPGNIPGIDIKKGLAKVHGRMEAYATVLRLFKQDFETACRDIESGLNNGDTESVRRLAHTLKSASGNIGADKLFLTVKAAEDEIARDGSLSQGRLEEFRLNLSEVIASINQALQDHSPCGGDEPALPGLENSVHPDDDLEPLILELERLVIQNSMKAEQKAIELQKQTNSKAAQQEFDHLIKSLERFQFKEARRILQDIVRILKPPRI